MSMTFRETLERVESLISHCRYHDAVKLLGIVDIAVLTVTEGDQYSKIVDKVLAKEKELNEALLQANEHIAHMNINEALEVLNAIPNWKMKPFVLNKMIECYEILGNEKLGTKFTKKADHLFESMAHEDYANLYYSDALDNFRQISSHNNDKEVSLDIARCLNKMEKYKEAHKQLEFITQKWPCFEKGQYYFCQFLLETNAANAKSQLKNRLKLFPNMMSLRSLAREYFPEDRDVFDKAAKQPALYPRFFDYCKGLRANKPYSRMVEALDLAVAAPTLRRGSGS